MKDSLDHLPAAKRREIRKVLDALFEEMEQENQLKTKEWKRRRRILKVILFGSYARGDWVKGEQPSGYRSDYDILIIVSHKSLVEDRDFTYRAEDRLMHIVRTPVSFIVHTLGEVNDALSRGLYFFTDIKRQGVALFEAKGGKPLAEPGALPPDVALDVAEEHFGNWFPIAEEFFEITISRMEKKSWKMAAFLLHQATEGYYSTALLVLTNYTPNTHNIKHLRSLCESRDERFISAF